MHLLDLLPKAPHIYCLSMKMFDGMKSRHCCSRCSIFIVIIFITINNLETDLHYWPGFRWWVSMVGLFSILMNSVFFLSS